MAGRRPRRLPARARRAGQAAVRLRGLRAPSRSPNFYLSSISSFGLSSGATLSRLGRLVQQPPPFDVPRADAILAHMQRIPAILEQAKRNLTEPTVEMSRRALPALADAWASGRRFAEALAAIFPSAMQTYWEETAPHLGYYDERPRSRELIYNFLRLRALRVVVDVRMATGDMTVDEATRALMTVPMDRRIASEEADDFFAVPTGGIVYLIGKMQIERLLGFPSN